VFKIAYASLHYLLTLRASLFLCMLISSQTRNGHYVPVSERAKPARREQMKTGHFEGRIAFGAADAAQRRDESTQREPVTFDFNFGGQWLVAAADCP
jgi:hypothetical protein